jgi:hypothetical protein
MPASRDHCPPQYLSVCLNNRSVLCIACLEINLKSNNEFRFIFKRNYQNYQAHHNILLNNHLVLKYLRHQESLGTVQSLVFPLLLLRLRVWKMNKLARFREIIFHNLPLRASQISIFPSKNLAVSQNSSLLDLSWPSVKGTSLFHLIVSLLLNRLD